MAQRRHEPRHLHRLLFAAARRIRPSITRRELHKPPPRRIDRARAHLLIETQRLTFREIHRQFVSRTIRGDQGLAPALMALDSLWNAVYTLRGGAPLVVRILAQPTHPDSPTASRLEGFYRECTTLLEDGIQRVFGTQADQLTIPPARMAVLIRILLSGLIVELARARDESDIAVIDQAYADFRELFQRFALSSLESPDPDDEEMLDIPLPW
ncbi:MAG: hypothetical protein AAFV53_09740 [Myxococcota bacterium]